MTEMLDDRFDDQLRDSARDYNTPPVTPREEMWAAIQARKAERAIAPLAASTVNASRRFGPVMWNSFY